MAEEGKKLLIKNGKLINHDLTYESDILIENGKIIRIESDISDESAETVDASGFCVFPGGIDSETYLNAERGGVKSIENYYTGTRAALFGGTTTIVNCIEITKSEDLKTKVEAEKSEASKNIVCNVALQAGISDFQSKTRDQLNDLISNKTLIRSVRLSSVSKGDHLVGLDDCQLYDIMSWCRINSIFPCVIAENDRLIQKLEKEMIDGGINGPEGHYYSRNERVEEEAVNRMLTIAGVTHCPLHLSRIYSRKALVKATTNYSSKIPLVLCGTNLAALTKNVTGILDSDWGKAAGNVSVPSVKNESSALKPIDIGRLHVLSSGHCVFSTQQKATGKDDFRLILPGSGGIQNRLSVLWEKAVKTGVIEKNRFVELTSTNVAKLHGLYPQKGTLSVGADADIVIWSERQVARKCLEACAEDNDENINCGPAYVILGGRIVVNPDSVDELINVTKGSGTFVNLQSEPGSSYSMAPVFQQAQLMHSLYYDKQCVAIQREPYTGPVATLGGDGTGNKNDSGVLLYSDMVDSAVYQRTKDEEHKEALPPGSRVIRTSVKTAQPPGGGSSQGNWWG